MTHETSTDASIGDVEETLERVFVAAEGASLREEDRKKAVEVRALLVELGRLVRGRRRALTLVDAAAGKAYVGLLAAELVFARRGLPFEIVAVERDARRVDAAIDAAKRLGHEAAFRACTASVDAATFPEAPTIVVALHACGEASDAVIDATIASRAKHLLLVPCCTARGVRGATVAEHVAEVHGVPSHGGVRKRLREVMVLAERVARLEAAGYATEVVDFVPPSVTPYNVLLRARRVDEAVRRSAAAAAHARLLDPPRRA